MRRVAMALLGAALGGAAGFLLSGALLVETSLFEAAETGFAWGAIAVTTLAGAALPYLWSRLGRRA